MVPDADHREMPIIVDQLGSVISFFSSLDQGAALWSTNKKILALQLLFLFNFHWLGKYGVVRADRPVPDLVNALMLLACPRIGD